MSAEPQVELGIAALAPSGDGYAASQWTYGVGREPSRAMRENGETGDVWLLSPLPRSATGTVRVERLRCISVPATLESRRALAVPMLATALWAWEEVGLELGETAVYASGTALDRMIGCVARWRGAVPIVRLAAAAGGSLDGVEDIDATDADVALKQLSETVRNARGFAAIDLSGRGEIFDILLEVLPRWGRILLGAPRSARVTVDFYNNVHRKGAYLRAVCLDPMALFDPARRQDRLEHVERAVRILSDDYLAGLCLGDD